MIGGVGTVIAALVEPSDCNESMEVDEEVDGNHDKGETRERRGLVERGEKNNSLGANRE